MYLAVKEFGKDFSEEIALEKDQQSKWQKIDDFLKELDAEGLHIESRYDSIGLDLDTIPDNITSNYRLTMHKNGINTLYTEEEYIQWDNEFAELFEIIKKYDTIEDLSFHPPVTKKEHPFYVEDLPLAKKSTSQNLLRKLVEKWIPKFRGINVTLSLESHISENFFIFYGPDDYIDFIHSIDGLCALLDVAHNHYDKYCNKYLIEKLQDKISGFHISDAIQGDNFREDIHREIDKVDIDFSFINHVNKNKNIFFAFEVKRDKGEIVNSIFKFRDKFRDLFCS